jgi:hypothetical protein
MAITENKYTGNGSTVLYSFTFPYLEVADIKVSLDGTLTTAYTLANATTVQFNTAPANGVAIRLFRQTNDEALNAQFFPGSAIRSTDLNNNFTQNLYVTQESNRDATQGITTADAATATANTALSNSSAAVSTANTASSNASAAVSTANTASSNASAAVSTANTASSNATAAVNTANAATATANSAASDAATAISTANSAVSTANTASTAATNAVNTANSASSAASSAVSTANTASSNASAAVSTANTASSNATSAVNTANSALSTANAAASAVANAILYDIVANVAAIPASPANNDAVEVTDSTGIESFTPLISIPGGFAGNSGLSVRIVYTTTGNTWTWIQYFPNDPETRYLKEAVTTSDTAPVSPSDGDLWYDSVGGRTYVYYDDGAGSQWVDTSPQGSGVSDAISEGDTSAEVIDTGSDGRFVVTTEGSERLRITSAGLVGIGTNSPTSAKLDVRDDANYPVRWGSTSAQFGELSYETGNCVIGATSGNKLTLRSAGTAAITIDSSQRVGIGTTSPIGKLSVSNSGACGIEFTPYSTYTEILSYNRSTSAYVPLTSFASTHSWNDGNGERLRIDSSGHVGIGTSSPNRTLHVYGDQAFSNSNNTGTLLFAPAASANYIYSRAADNAITAVPLGIAMGSTDVVRIDTSGNVGIGTAAPDSRFVIRAHSGVSNTPIFKIEHPSNDADFAISGLYDTDGNITYLGSNLYYNSSYAVARFDTGKPSSGISLSGRTGNGEITFLTGTATATERMRITSDGSTHVFNGGVGIRSISSAGAGTSVTIFRGSYSGTGNGFAETGTESIYIWSNGNVQNANNSYGAISDIKLKENIVDASSQWDDLKALQVRNYNFKEGQTHTQIGLIAQEVELVSPGLVSESPDRDEDGNDLGTVTKSVNYSVLYMKAVKALQEAMTRIETLEAANTDLAARLTALEGGTN